MKIFFQINVVVSMSTCFRIFPSFVSYQITEQYRYWYIWLCTNGETRLCDSSVKFAINHHWENQRQSVNPSRCVSLFEAPALIHHKIGIPHFQLGALSFFFLTLMHAISLKIMNGSVLTKATKPQCHNLYEINYIINLFWLQ